MLDTRSPAIAAFITIIVLVGLVFLSLFTQLIAFNGVSERQGIIAVGVSLGCQFINIVLCSFLARALANSFLNSRKGRKLYAIGLAVFLSTFVGFMLAIIALLVSVFIAGIK